MNQLMKFCPKIHKEYCHSNYEKMFLLMKNNLNKGIDLNSYRNDLNKDLIIRFFFFLNFAIKSDDLFTNFQLNTKKLNYSLLNYHLQSILTDAGRIDFIEIEKKYHTNSNI